MGASGMMVGVGVWEEGRGRRLGRGEGGSIRGFGRGKPGRIVGIVGGMVM